MHAEVDPLVYVVDDETIARTAIQATLAQSGFRCRSYVCAGDFLRGCAEGDGRAVVVDIRMPEMTGIELVSHICTAELPLGIVVVSAYANTQDVVSAMRDGAVTVLDKPYRSDELREAVRGAVRKGEEMFARRLRRTELAERFDRMTARELAVLVLVSDGVQNRSISARLGCAVRTVEQRRARIFAKTETNSPAALVRFWMDVESELPDRADRARKALASQQSID